MQADAESALLSAALTAPFRFLAVRFQLRLYDAYPDDYSNQKLDELLIPWEFSNVLIKL
jgi:hypothetical protein